MTYTAYVLNASGVVSNAIVLDDDTSPTAFGAVPGPEGAGIGWTYDGVAWMPPAEPEPEPQMLGDLRASKIAAIVAAADALLATGAPVNGGLHVALDDGARADLTAMATTATAAASGAIAWPEAYARGWISMENVRIPLATPAAGLALAAIVGDWYARIVQRRRDLKDAVLAAPTADALAAIDIDAGWPV